MLVLGGGISGLSAAHYLLKAGVKEVSILEASNRLGGWIQSINDPKTDLVFEKGPRTLRVNTASGMNTLSLIEELGIESKIKPILKSHPAAKNRLIYVGSKLHPLPTSFYSIFKKFPPFSKPMYYAALRDLFSPSKLCSDDSVYDFTERRFGSEIADFLISPLICGICAGDAKEISVKLLMPLLFEYEQAYGSVLKGMIFKIKENLKNPDKLEINTSSSNLVRTAINKSWNVYGLQGGLEILPNALTERIRIGGGNIHLETKVSELIFKEHSVICKIGSKVIECNHVISALPAKKLAPLLNKQHPQLAKQLASISYVTVCVVNLAYKINVLKVNAFGLLVPPSQNVPLLGVVFDSCSFPQNNWTILTAMLGGKWFDKQIGQKTDEEILGLVKSQIKLILDVQMDPDSYHISIMKDCIPQYTVGHTEKIKSIYSYIKDNKLPLTLVGSTYKGVGVNDAIFSSKLGVEEIINK